MRFPLIAFGPSVHFGRRESKPGAFDMAVPAIPPTQLSTASIDQAEAAPGTDVASNTRVRRSRDVPTHVTLSTVRTASRR